MVIDGVNLLPYLTGEKPEAPHETLFWRFGPQSAIRQGKWKLVSRHPDRWELYDLEADRTELHDLASEQPEKVKEMSGSWDRWAADAGVVPWDELTKGKQQKKAAKTQPAK